MELKVTFSQNNDCMESSDNGQFLTIRTENGGGGDFFILETERWSYESIDEIIKTLTEFKDKHDAITATKSK